MYNVYMEVIMTFIGANLSGRKVLPRTPFQRLFADFFQIGRSIQIKNPVFIELAPYLEKIKYKVLGREFEGEPFFKRVSLNNCRNTSI